MDRHWSTGPRIRKEGSSPQSEGTGCMESGSSTMVVHRGVQKIRRRTECWNLVQRPGGRVPVPSCEDTSASGVGKQFSYG